MKTIEPAIGLVDSHHGIHAQRVLVENYRSNLCDWRGNPWLPGDLDYLASDDLGAWDDIEPYIRNDENGLIYRLDWREGDIIAIHPDAEWSDYLDEWFIRGDAVEYQIPSWAMCYLVNGDNSGLTDHAIDMCDTWSDSEDGHAFHRGFTIISEPYFSRSNDLGDCLACDVVDVLVYPM